MKNQSLPGLFINLYLATGMIHLFMMASGNTAFEAITKFALMPALWLYVITSAGFTKQVLWLSMALLFSWAGDILLFYTTDNAWYFLFGLAAFLVAHICYIIAFLQLVNQKIIAFKWKYAAPLVVFCFLLLGYLYNGLSDMRFPVILYAVVITTMGVAAMHRKGLASVYSYGFVLSGALLFIISDSLIAINKFQNPFSSASFLIMATYIAAQYLIASGCVMHIKEKAPL